MCSTLVYLRKPIVFITLGQTIEKFAQGLENRGGDTESILHAMIMSTHMMKRILESILHAMICIQWHVSTPQTYKL